jgi:hypothetical protein
MPDDKKIELNAESGKVTTGKRPREKLLGKIQKTSV